MFQNAEMKTRNAALLLAYNGKYWHTPERPEDPITVEEVAILDVAILDRKAEDEGIGHSPMIHCGECIAFLPLSPDGEYGQCRLRAPVAPVRQIAGSLDRQWPQVQADEQGCLEGRYAPALPELSDADAHLAYLTGVAMAEARRKWPPWWQFWRWRCWS